jgi:hypothetical protein
MAGAGHGAGFAVTAAANHGLALLFLFDHIHDDSRNYSDEHGADDDSPYIL